MALLSVGDKQSFCCFCLVCLKRLRLRWSCCQAKLENLPFCLVLCAVKVPVVKISHSYFLPDACSFISYHFFLLLGTESSRSCVNQPKSLLVLIIWVVGVSSNTVFITCRKHSRRNPVKCKHMCLYRCVKKRKKRGALKFSCLTRKTWSSS